MLGRATHSGHTNVPAGSNFDKTEPSKKDINAQKGFVELASWFMMKCRFCFQSFDLRKAKNDMEGNVICPHCKRAN